MSDCVFFWCEEGFTYCDNAKRDRGDCPHSTKKECDLVE